MAAAGDGIAVGGGILANGNIVSVGDLKQNYGSFGRLTNTKAPALLRESVLWDFVRDRPVVTEELWLLQGFPHPALVPSAPSQFSFLSTAAVTLEEQNVLLGNSMHLVQVAAEVLIALACTQKQ